MQMTGCSDPVCQENPVWPKGTYSLIRAEKQVTCPEGFESGERFQDTEGVIVAGGNEWSDPCDLKGPYTIRDITLNFCTKSSIANDPDVEWAEGRYCIMKKGTSCPNGKRI